MSRTDANTEKTGTLENVARPDNLHWDVFVTPGRLSMACATPSWWMRS